jgi:hypothetical protein
MNNFNFAVVLYRPETWSLNLMVEHRFELKNRMLRSIVLFGPKRDKVTGLHNEEYHNL